MQIVLAVIDDLFQFAKTSLFGIRPVILDSDTHYAPTIVPALPASRAQTPPIPAFASYVETQTDVLLHDQQYFIGECDVCLYTDPVVSFDTTCGELTYGTVVHLIKFGGRWAQVRAGENIGWVLKDVLREQPAEVFPHFVEHVYYDAQHPETIKLRAVIADTFGCARAGIVLTCSEYVVYELIRKHHTVPWDAQRPRLPGTWQKKLRGRTGVHIGIAPRTDSVMEYVLDDVGYVAYVESVFPDESIKVSSVGLYQDGQYTQEVLSKERYRELQPVFITVG